MNKDSGKIIALPQFTSGTSAAGKVWQKQDVIIEWGDKYKNVLCVTFFGDKMQMLEKFSVGDNVKVEYNASSRSFEKDGKTSWFHNISGFSIDFDLDNGNSSFKASDSGAFNGNDYDDGNDKLPF